MPEAGVVRGCHAAEGGQRAGVGSILRFWWAEEKAIRAADRLCAFEQVGGS